MTTIALPAISSNPNVIQNYKDALASAGAETFVMAPTADEEEIRRQIGQCDGVLLMGGADIPPQLYGCPRHPAIQAILSPEISFFYSTAARIALLETRKPVLGICLGIQIINVIFGGTLYADLPQQVPQALWHARPPKAPTLETMHEVRFPADSPLCQIIGTDWLPVNSSHHQAVCKLGKGLKAAAFAKDGVIEAVCPSTDTGRFLLGVQWHPERIFSSIAGHQKILQAFVDACAAPSIQVQSTKTMLIRGGNICDGTGAEICRKDVLLAKGKILAMLEPGEAVPADAEIIPAEGMLVAPGFIDAHAHSELRKLEHPQFRTKLLQGVTTEVNGNCGSCPVCVPGKLGDMQWNNLAEYVDLLEHSGQSTNSVLLCGHGALRNAVMGNADHAPSPDEMSAMKTLLCQALETGAAGMSTGLTYFPGKFASTEELVELAKELKGKVYASHVRNEGDTLLEAAQEAISIADQANCPLQFSHIKTMFPRNHHKAPELICLLEQARAKGISIQADRYPYVHSQTSLRQILPAPLDKVPEIHRYIAASPENYAEVARSLKHSPRDLASTILLNAPYKGMTILEASRQAGKSMEELATELLRDCPSCQAAYLAMSWENLERFLMLPWVCPGSDGLNIPLDDSASYGHPRGVATFPHFFQFLSKRLGIPETIRRMTALPAAIFHIPERGLLRPGFVADITILDPEHYASPADFSGRELMPTGIRQVLVAGSLAFDHNRPEFIGANGHYLPIRS